MPARASTSPRRPSTRCVFGIVVLALLAGAQPALADGLDDACGSFDAGRVEEARAQLSAWLTDGAASAPRLLAAADLARNLQDLDVLGLFRAAGERLEEHVKADPTLDLALGFAYLGLAEENLRQRTAGSSVSLYFADALSRAAKVTPDPDLGATATLLAAETHQAKGDAEAALRVIEEGRKARASAPPARLLALEGTLRYERGVAGGTDAEGRPTAEARADFDAAIAALGAALDAGTLPAAEVRRVELQHAWAHHRIGSYDPAIASYHAAYESGSREATLAVRGLQSLLGLQPARLAAELGSLVEENPADEEPVDALIQAQLAAGDAGGALLGAHDWLGARPDEAAALYKVGFVLQAAGRLEGAKRYFVEVLKRTPDDLRASAGIERLAQGYVASAPERAMAVYEELLKLRPACPYIRNNYGFLLRELVTPHTTMDRTSGLQRIEPGAPAEIRRMLDRCVEVYAEAAARIDPAQDGTREELDAWNVAGIVNDYGLILHYFLDVQDGALAEQQYLRALRMTDHGFKDTYCPNLQRLYRHVLQDRPWTWYRLAREARDAILKETVDEQGGLVLVPDEEKRASARRDVPEARARILQTLALDAEEDGLPWPPQKENGNDR